MDSIAWNVSSLHPHSHQPSCGITTISGLEPCWSLLKLESWPRSCPTPIHPPTARNFSNGQMWPHHCPSVKPFRGSSGPQSKFQASVYHYNQVSPQHSLRGLCVRVFVSLPGIFSPIFHWLLSYPPNLFTSLTAHFLLHVPRILSEPYLFPSHHDMAKRRQAQTYNHTQCCELLLILCVFLPPHPPTPHSPRNCKLSRGQKLSASFATASLVQCSTEQETQQDLLNSCRGQGQTAPGSTSPTWNLPCFRHIFLNSEVAIATDPTLRVTFRK